MNILCDTCSVLMLIRIAPNMFTDERYDCVTVPEVRKEFFQTQKFKTKYPWRTQFKNKVIALKVSALENENFKLHFSAIRKLNNAGIINNRTDRYFGLSYIDQRIAAYAVAHKFILNSVDDDLCDFIVQEFETKTITPLGIINDWLEKGLILWEDSFQEIIKDWERCNEHPQSKTDVKRFIELSGYKYIGPVKK